MPGEAAVRGMSGNEAKPAIALSSTRSTMQMNSFCGAPCSTKTHHETTGKMNSAFDVACHSLIYRFVELLREK